MARPWDERIRLIGWNGSAAGCASSGGSITWEVLPACLHATSGFLREDSTPREIITIARMAAIDERVR